MASPYSDAPRENAIAQINITPLVDVMLVLLIIFMVAAPAISSTLAVQLPQPGREPVAVQAPLRLQVNASGEFVLDGRLLGAAALRDALSDVARRAPEAVLRIDASGEADYQAFATALAAAQSSGLVNLSVE